MQARTLLALTLISLVLISLGFLTACGSGSSTHVQPSAPTFTSVPVTAATQDVAYTYELAAVDPAGNRHFFSDLVPPRARPSAETPLPGLRRPLSRACQTASR